MSTHFDISLEQLARDLDPGARLAGLDLGSKTIGIALSDPGLRIASPMETIRKKKFSLDVKLLLEFCENNLVGGLVIGMPINMDGSEGPRCQSTRSFIRNLQPLCGIPVTLWDERLSTVAVTRTLLAADTSRKRRSEVVDKLAASYILQGALDRLKHQAQN
ncbi:MAG: Holliday junction resolvase RuvX [Cohaesibacteraceae bacterium]|nr:Holliday junction resolvase RuvX [Cohaesibacteraceae bacterium]